MGTAVPLRVYVTLVGKRYISIYFLVEGEYQVRQFRNGDACGGKQRLESPAFPELNLTAEQIFQAANLPT